MSIFARIIDGSLPASIVYRDDTCIAFMDIHPMAHGHVLVCPLTAVARMNELDDATRTHLWRVAHRISEAQQTALGSLAQHILVNDGPGASQTVPHVHIHLIPRYRGDRLRTLLRIITHIGVLAVAPPISARKRRQLDDQAARLAGQLNRV